MLPGDERVEFAEVLSQKRTPVAEQRIRKQRLAVSDCFCRPWESADFLRSKESLCEGTEDEPGKWVGLAGLEKGGSETTMEPTTAQLARFVRYRAIT